ncbi:hypothetical protein Tco_0458420 [Tanacetum coccineum]
MTTTTESCLYYATTIRYTQRDLDYAAGRNLKGLNGEEAWETIEDCVQCDKQWRNTTSTISDQTIANFKAQLVENEVVRVMIPKCMSWLDAYDEPIGDMMKKEDKTEPTKEVHSFDELEPQLLPNFSPLDVNLGDKRGTDPLIKPHSLDSYRMKEVDTLTIHTPPSPHVASFHPKDTYCYYHPCIDDLKKHYGFKPGLLGQRGSPSVGFLNMEMIEND